MNPAVQVSATMITGLKRRSIYNKEVKKLAYADLTEPNDKTTFNGKPAMGISKSINVEKETNREEHLILKKNSHKRRHIEKKCIVTYIDISNYLE